MRVIALIVILSGFSSCCQQSTSQAIISNYEYEVLAKDCEYVKRVLSDKFRKNKSSNSYEYDEKKITLLSKSDCFVGFNKQDLIDFLGTPSRKTDAFILYRFEANARNNFYQINFRFEGDTIVGSSVIPGEKN